MRTKRAAIFACVVLVALVGVRSLVQGNTQGQIKIQEPMAKLLPGDSEMDDAFGWSVAISGNTLVVGAPTKDAGEGLRDSGAAYIFERDGSKRDGWRRVQKIEASDRAADSRFAQAVALSGDFIVAGASGHNSRAGVAYIFERNAGGNGLWGEVQKLQVSAGGRFGWSVAISRNTVVVGAPADDARGASSGSAYLFERKAGSSGQWGLIKKLTASDGAEGDNFGAAVAISGRMTVVGAPRHNQVAGAAYIFEPDDGEIPSWKEVGQLQAADATPNRYFGAPIAVDGNRIVVGAPDDSDNGPGSGAAYLFERSPREPVKWEQVQKIRAGDGEPGEHFGLSVALAGDRILLGAADDDQGNHAGAVYLFEGAQAGQGKWTQTRKVTAPGEQAGFAFFRVALEGNTAVVGASGSGAGEAGSRSGSAYVFAAGLPSFADYPTGGKLTGKPAAPVLSDAEARRYRTVIRQQAAAGPNFAGRYTIATWGCSSTCVGFAVVDARNGKVHSHPEVRRAMQVAYQVEKVLQFRLDSRLLVIAGETEGPNGQSSRGKFYYEWVDDGFRRITTSEIQLEPGVGAGRFNVD